MDFKQSYEEKVHEVAELKRRIGILETELKKLHVSASEVRHSPMVERTERAVPSGVNSIPILQSGSSFSEELYAEIRARILNDHSILAVISQLRPEIEVQVQRQKLIMDDSKLRGRIAIFISEGFYDEPQTNSATLAELARRGWASRSERVSEAFGDLTRMGFLVKEDGAYRAVPKMKVRVVDSAA